MDTRKTMMFIKAIVTSWCGRKKKEKEEGEYTTTKLTKCRRRSRLGKNNVAVGDHYCSLLKIFCIAPKYARIPTTLK